MKFKLLKAETYTVGADGELSPVKARAIVGPLPTGGKREMQNVVVCQIPIYHSNATTRDECERRAKLILDALNAGAKGAQP